MKNYNMLDAFLRAIGRKKLRNPDRVYDLAKVRGGMNGKGPRARRQRQIAKGMLKP